MPTKTHDAHKSTLTHHAQMSVWICDMLRSTKSHKSYMPTKIYNLNKLKTQETEAKDNYKSI
ncbi:hypothetical protein K7432_017992 [Basidiobolus ranarum]|uniref:Uncharacterized protein n=1 Tax=Basidiobolus ranarum TaxID=34480 RepID=A0ABR2VJL4_9FUNG